MITQVGKHKVQHGNVMDGIDSLMQGEQADFIYSDPPWGQGNLRYWQTMNKKMTGAEKVDIDYTEFLHKYFEIIAKYAKDRIILEYGCQWREDIIDWAKQYGFQHHATRVCYYKAGAKDLPCDLHFLSKSGNVSQDEIPAEDDQNLVDLRDLGLLKFLWGMYAPKELNIVLDPMCGMGFSAQMAIYNGAAFRGNELNAARLQKTIDRLAKDKSA